MTMLEDFLKDLAPLVNLDCGTSNTAGVTRAAEIMKAHYESIGFTCELVDLGPTVGKGLLARNKPEAGYYDVMMNAHLDTVFPDGTAAARPLSVDGDRAHGPGCSDCKGGVLAVFYALKNARKEDLDRLSICVAYNPDEETGSVASTEWLASHGKHAKNVLIFEAARAGGELVRSRKGVGSFTVTFKGVSAHAGNNPWDGRNANVAAMKFALAAYELADAELGTTVNPGVLKGGSAPNVISDSCEVQIDIRYWKDEDGRALKAKIEDLVGKTGSKASRRRCASTVSDRPCRSPKTRRNSSPRSPKPRSSKALTPVGRRGRRLGRQPHRQGRRSRHRRLRPGGRRLPQRPRIPASRHRRRTHPHGDALPDAHLIAIS